MIADGQSLLFTRSPTVAQVVFLSYRPKPSPAQATFLPPPGRRRGDNMCTPLPLPPPSTKTRTVVSTLLHTGQKIIFSSQKPLRLNPWPCGSSDDNTHLRSQHTHTQTKTYPAITHRSTSQRPHHTHCKKKHTNKTKKYKKKLQLYSSTPPTQPQRNHDNSYDYIAAARPPPPPPRFTYVHVYMPYLIDGAGDEARTIRRSSQGDGEGRGE